MDDLLEPPAPVRRRRARPVEKVEALAPAPTTPDAIEIAMELEQGDPSPDSPARRVLVEHARLLSWQVADQRMGVALKVLAMLAVVAGLAVVGALLWKGQRSTALVVEAFSTPPALAEQGVTGQAVAARLLDRLARFQAETDTARAPGTFANDWSGEVKVEIPGTGLSIADLDRVLGRSLRRETRVSGELARTPAGGLSLTTRVGTQALTVEGRGDALDALVQQTAEAIYRDTQPYRYAIWLSGQGRAAEAKAAMRDLALNGPIAEQPFALAGYSNFLRGEGDQRGALRYARRALEVDPDFGKAWWNISDAQQLLGLAQDELVTQREIQRDRWRHDPMVTRLAESHVRLGAAAREGELLGDYAGAVGYLAERTELAEWNGNRVGARSQQIVDIARAHDPDEARRLAELYEPVLADASLSAPIDRALAEARGDWVQAAAHGRRELAAYAPTIDLWTVAATAEALARSGDLAGAEALVGPTAGDCYPCLVARGRIAALKGDARGADRWFGQAVKQGASLPLAYAAWGEAKAARGDLAGAVALYREAQARGPKWADPYKLEGDALVRGGDRKTAAKRYAEAARLAPRWDELRRARAAKAKAG